MYHFIWTNLGTWLWTSQYFSASDVRSASVRLQCWCADESSCRVGPGEHERHGTLLRQGQVAITLTHIHTTHQTTITHIPGPTRRRDLQSGILLIHSKQLLFNVKTDRLIWWGFYLRAVKPSLMEKGHQLLKNDTLHKSFVTVLYPLSSLPCLGLLLTSKRPLLLPETTTTCLVWEAAFQREISQRSTN